MSSTGRVPPGDIAQVRAALDADYEVLDELGRGGMAMVYRARERQLDREVAVKVLPMTLSFDTELVSRFQREARLAARLEHPSIVPIYRVGHSGHVIFFVMKLLRGQSVSQRLAVLGRLPATEVRRVLMDTASALGYAHRRGIVHRDVKPDNVMLDEEGRAVVTDFGIARSVTDSKLTAAGMSVGTPRYMSPEQARAREVDGRSDLYSLGILGYQCLTGRVPFDDGEPLAILMQHLEAPVPRPTMADSGSDDERAVYAAIERLLAKEPDDRFQTADELIAALESGIVPPAPAVTRQTVAVERDRVAEVARTSAALASAMSAAVADGFSRGIAHLERQRPRVAVVARAAAWSRAHAMPPLQRYWKHGVAALAGALGLYWATHFVLLHRSRCPAVSPVDASGRAARPSPFRVMIESSRSIRQGGGLDVYYDLCGIPEGTVRTVLVITRRDGGVRPLLGGWTPTLTFPYDDAVRSSATRRHRSLDVSQLPTGEYNLDIVATDARKRRQNAGAEFEVRGR